MLVEPPPPSTVRDIDVLWVSNIQHLKRPDRILELAGKMPEVKIHMVGGPLSGQEALFRDIANKAATTRNVTFHGRLSYWDANDLYGRAKVLVNTSDVEGFPNSYVQAWIRGVPVVTLIDPDRVIEREGLGIAARYPAQIPDAVRSLLGDPAAWNATSDRCHMFMAREYGEEKVLADYFDTFVEVMRIDTTAAGMIVSGEVRHV